MSSAHLWLKSVHFRRFAAGSVAVAAAVAVSGVAPQVAPAGPRAIGPAVRAATDAVSANRLAAATDSRVEVLADRTEYAQLFAEPTGQFTYESAVVPQRVHRADGSWADVDLSLVAGIDGAIRPRASAADVRFSAGGSGPLATLVRDSKSLTLSWPLGDLPVPSISGDSATYSNVLPDVDLVVRATRDGFSDVLAVKTAAAAADPRIKEVTFDLGGTAEVRRGRDGSLAALAGGAVIASAAVPAMWDSAKTFTGAAVKSKMATAAGETGTSADPSTAAAPADTARTAPVGTALTSGGDLILRPDRRVARVRDIPALHRPRVEHGQDPVGVFDEQQQQQYGYEPGSGGQGSEQLGGLSLGISSSRSAGSRASSFTTRTCK